MYSLPKDINLEKIKNETISQIAFGINYVLLVFTKSSIQFSGPFSFKSKGRIETRDEVYPVDFDFGLLQLLEHKITHINCSSERTSIVIVFEDGSELSILSSEMYESYEINMDGERIIV